MSDAVNRREFVTAGATAAGALALGSSRLFAQGSQTVNVGIVGCGGRGSGASGTSSEADKDVKIAAICDLVEGKAKGALANVKRKAPNQVTATNDTLFHGLDAYKKVLAADVNYVILATPPGFRPMHMQAAVAAGKNIFTEKPVGVDGPGIRKVLAAAEEAKKKGLARRRRHPAPAPGRLHRDDEADPRRRDRRHRRRPAATGTRAASGSTPRKPSWTRHGVADPQLVLLHLAVRRPHRRAARPQPRRGQLGHRRPTRSRRVGMGGRQVRTAARTYGHIFDHFAIDYEYPNGVHVHEHVPPDRGLREQRLRDGRRHQGHPTDGQRLHASTASEFGSASRRRNPYVQEHIDLFASIRDGKPLNELKQVAESTLTAIMGRMSAYTGKAVTWDEALHGEKWFEDTMPKHLTLDMALPADPPPVVGRWRPKKTKA